MKKILLSLFIIICFSGSALAWSEIQKGVYLGNLQFNGNVVSYSMKIDSTSDLWQNYARQQNLQGINYGYLQGNFSINCSVGSVKGDMEIYDNGGNLLGTFTSAETPNENIAAMCASVDFSKISFSDK